jgi:3-dehydroquinate dehydratase
MLIKVINDPSLDALKQRGVKIEGKGAVGDIVKFSFV